MPVPSRDEHRGRARHARCRSSHRERVGAGGPGRRARRRARGAGSSTRSTGCRRTRSAAGDGVGTGRLAAGPVGEQRGVARAVERGPRIVGHAAVDRDVRRCRARALDPADRVERHPARATSDRPGSRISWAAGTPCSCHARSSWATRPPHELPDREQPGSSGTCNPEPTAKVDARGVQPSSARARAAKPAIQSTVISEAPRSRSCEPMWTCSPSAVAEGASAASASSRQAELRAVMAVFTSRACRPRCPGVTRIRNHVAPRARARPSSESESRTTARRRPSRRGAARPPCCCRGRRGARLEIPARCANASSPAVETSAPRPWAAKSRSTASEGEGFVP